MDRNPILKPVTSELERAKYGIPLDSDRYTNSVVYSLINQNIFVFFRCFCVACYDDYCDWPECLGGKNIVKCCCCETTSVFCKSIHDATMWHVLQSETCNLVVPRVCYHRYCQCCCFQCFCALPDLDVAFTETNVAPVDVSAVRDSTHLSSESVVCL